MEGMLDFSASFISRTLTFVKQAGSADSNDTSSGCLFSPSGTCFTDRKLNAVRVYHEWMPIRQVSSDDKLRIWRNFEIGNLMVGNDIVLASPHLFV